MLDKEKANVFKMNIRTWKKHKANGTLIRAMREQVKRYNINIDKYDFENFYYELDNNDNSPYNKQELNC